MAPKRDVEPEPATISPIVEPTICYLKMTKPCVARRFEVPEDDGWIYAASPDLLTTVCGDCRLWFKAQLKERSATKA